MASRIHLFKKSAIEAGTPKNYYLDPSDNLMKMISKWKAVEHQDYISVKLHLLGFGDVVRGGAEGQFVKIEVELENSQKAARFDHKDGMKSFKIKMNAKFLKKAKLSDDVKDTDEATNDKIRIYIRKKKVAGFSMAPKIHMLKKSAIEAGTPSNYYLKPEENLMKLSSEWKVVEQDDALTVCFNHKGFGDQISVTGKQGNVCVKVAKQNKERAARFDFLGDGMEELKMKMNTKFLNHQIKFQTSKGITKCVIRKLKLKYGDKNPNLELLNQASAAAAGTSNSNMSALVLSSFSSIRV